MQRWTSDRSHWLEYAHQIFCSWILMDSGWTMCRLKGGMRVAHKTPSHPASIINNSSH